MWKTDTRRKKPQVVQRLAPQLFSKGPHWFPEDHELEGAPTGFPHLIRFRSQHFEFLLPELRSLSDLYGYNIGFSARQAHYVSSLDDSVTVANAPPDCVSSNQTPFLPVRFEKVEHIKKIAQRCVTVQWGMPEAIS